MTASSYHEDEQHSAKYGRLFDESGYGWFPKNRDKTDWLQVDLGEEFQVCAVATQGGNYDKEYKEWTTAFKLLYSSDDNNRKTYKDRKGVVVVSWIFTWSVWVSKSNSAFPATMNALENSLHCHIYWNAKLWSIRSSPDPDILFSRLRRTSFFTLNSHWKCSW